ncbi:minor capsid protein [Anaerovorax odorimutans]|uniref:minor capsid protein n=1 Tax=Anaerovorax odorimutans TaxID=109327 RepID=UPI0003FD237D|nr:minor capsid protein [Anaerovorax odorimutans]
MKIETPRGKVIKTKGGNVRLEWNPNFQPQIETAFTRTQKFIDSEVLRLSNPYVPMQSGMLQKLGILGTVIGSGSVVYEGPYARYLYYGKVMVGRVPKQLTDNNLTFHGAPKRGAFWFERMKADKKDQILRGAAKIIKRESR